MKSDVMIFDLDASTVEERRRGEGRSSPSELVRLHIVAVNVDSIAVSVFVYWLSWTNTVLEQKIPITILILRWGARLGHTLRGKALKDKINVPIYWRGPK